MTAITAVPDGGTIVDAPCGSGVALRALQPAQRVRYLGYDLSPQMLRRAKRHAERLGLDQVEVREADAESLPLAAESADLFSPTSGCTAWPILRPRCTRRHAACGRAGG